MANKFTIHNAKIEAVAPFLVLLILLPYTYAHFFVRPYTGLHAHPISGEINQIYSQGSQGEMLNIGDKITHVGTTTWENFTKTALSNGQRIEPGQLLPLTILRDVQEFDIIWEVPTPTQRERSERLFEIWWIAYVFWLAGTVVVFFIRPRRTQKMLLAADFYLVAVWLAAGLVSGWNIWSGSSILHATFWILMPVALHFHWIFPSPLARPSKFWWLIYVLGFSLAIADWFHLLPSSAYLIGGLIAAFGSIILLFIHAITQPEYRRDVIPLLALITLSLLPAIVLGVASIIRTYSSLDNFVLISLIALPWAYIFAVYRRQLGVLELRRNRVISLYIFFLLLTTIFVFLGVLVEPQIIRLNSTTIVAFFVLAAIISSILTLVFYSPFQRFVEHQLIGIPYAQSHLLETYSARITTSLDINSLTQVLTEEILPSMMVRQSVLLRFKGTNDTQTLFTYGVPEDALSNAEDIKELLQLSSTYLIHPDRVEAPSPWVHLSIPLKQEKKLIGAWLLGSHDPDDFYSTSEINILQAIADQTAIALTNIDQAEYLHALYQINIDRHESERQKLALELHDEVLGQIAIMVSNPNGAYQSEQLNSACQTIATRIREIVDGLRPAMLNYGLRSAIDELCDTVSDLSDDEIIFQVEIPQSGIRYQSHAELHLFRIIQQACNNVLKHAQAKSVKIYGRMDSDKVDLTVEDDGIGFVSAEPIDLPDLLSKQNFGIVGMHERAALIDAELNIYSKPGHGTRVHITWKPAATQIEYEETDPFISHQESSH